MSSVSPQVLRRTTDFRDSGLNLSHTLVEEMKRSRQSVFPFAMLVQSPRTV